MKQLFTLFVALLSACTFSAYAAIVDGTCGDNLTWTLNTKDSTLTISGTGEMTDYKYTQSSPWYDYKSYIKYAVIQDGVTNIANFAFESCSNLTSITIPNGVTTIGEHSFWYCSSLSSITFPETLTTIGEWAFTSCTSLTSITIPSSVTKLYECAFAWSKNIKAVYISDLVAWCNIDIYSAEANPLTYAHKLYLNGKLIEDLVIPSEVTDVKSATFIDNTSLKSVTFGANITSINSGAFVRCDNIKEVTSYAPVPPSVITCGIKAESCTLHVPAEYLDTYSKTLWWEDFKEIRAINTDYVVTFFDWDNTILARVAVAAGKAATAPEAPVREGYTFIGWDKDFSFVTSDMDVYAQYEMNAVEKDLTLVFNDFDNNQISTQTVSIIIPYAPEINGFTFLYWQTITAPVGDVITIQAVYESNTPTEAPEVYVNPVNPTQKLLRNGQVYILKDDKTYTIMGAQIQ